MFVNLSYGQVLAGSSRNFGDGSSNGRSPSLRNDHTVGACCVGGAQDRAQIVGIFHAIEDEHERILSALGSDHVIEIAVLLRRRYCYHALVCRVARHAVEFDAR